jgi:serine/threonine protein kinase
MNLPKFDGIRSFDSWIVGQVIGDYRILSPIGSGGMSSVYKAEKTGTSDRVVFKFLRPGAGPNVAEDRLRFEQEVQALQRINHPNVVEFLESGEYNDIPYIIMPFLDGWNLQEVLQKQGRLSYEKALFLTCELCQGLTAIHAEKIIHRDIKPENVMIVRGGSIKIVDLGIARHGDAQITAKGQLVATLAYSSPEHIQGDALTVRSDLFSVGATLYYMITREHPFAGQTTASTLYNVISRDPKPAKEWVPDLPDAVNDLIIRLLNKEASKRFESAHEVSLLCQNIRAENGFGTATRLDIFLSDLESLAGHSIAGKYPFILVRQDIVTGEQNSDDATTFAPLICAPKLLNAGEEQYSLGRGDENRIVIPVRTVSRVHAWIIGTEDRGFFVRDAGSTNGTLVNGELAKGAVRLKSKYVLTFGPEPSYVFYLGEDLKKFEKSMLGR